VKLTGEDATAPVALDIAGAYVVLIVSDQNTLSIALNPQGAGELDHADVRMSCCGHAETFENADAAFQAGWDVAPRFTVQRLCNLCPSAPAVLRGLDGARARHAEMHVWQRDGRPKDFNVAAELAADGATDVEVEQQDRRPQKAVRISKALMGALNGHP
jgi:hypothetical protein